MQQDDLFSGLTPASPSGPAKPTGSRPDAPSASDSPLPVDELYRPLAERLRPEHLAGFVGQNRVVGERSPFYQAIARKKAHSCLLWGPPGVGKTTLAGIYAQSINAHFDKLSAVEAGVRELRAVIEKARTRRQNGRPTILFLDEIHRFNKAQQDQLLPSVETGVLFLVGATTENPSFSLNNALLSRLRVYRLQPLAEADLAALLKRALSEPQGVAQTLGGGELLLDATAREELIHAADGDARRLLTLLELAAQIAEPVAESQFELTRSQLAELLVDTPRRFDQGGDYFYDQISAMHKAIRGSDPDAGAYWLLRMLDGGADPGYLARRLVRIASEDIGNADPRALSLCIDAWTAYDRLGNPEGALMLTQAAIYLAVAPKSNAVYNAHNALQAAISANPSLEVPVHLRNAPTELMKEQGFGSAYRYAHDYPDAYVPGEVYLPEPLNHSRYYQPVERGLERSISQRLDELEQRDRAAEDNAGQSSD